MFLYVIFADQVVISFIEIFFRLSIRFWEASVCRSALTQLVIRFDSAFYLLAYITVYK